MKVSDVVADFLVQRGIKTVFGIIGSANSHLYDSFVKVGIRIYNVHNEQCAVISAGAYYRTCGKLSAALVTAGGGVTNSVTGIVSLWADSIPTLVLAGQESSQYVVDHSHRRMYGTQGLDFVHMVSKTTKYAKCILEPENIQYSLETAYATALNGRKGPVMIEMPFDIQSKDIESRVWRDYKSHPLEADVNPLIDLLLKSKRPVILGGHGIKLSNSEKEFKALAESIGVPVLLTWSAIDILSHDSEYFFGSPGVYGQRAANFIFQKCDLLIVMGSRLTLPQTGYDMNEVARKAKIVMIDVDPTEFKEFVDVRINADCGECIKRLWGTTVDCKDWLEECTRIKKEFPLIDKFHVDGEFPNSYKVIDAISKYIKPGHTVVTDMGTALLSGHQVVRLPEGVRMFSSYGLGEMGYGLPAAFGAAVAANGREVLCLNCDGGMMMNIQELQTIVQHKLRVKIVIFNNDGYLMIKHTQKMLFKGNYTAVNGDTGITLPDYMKVATAFGYKGFRIQDWKEFEFYFPHFMDFDGPSICEIFMPPEQDFIPKVKGVLKEDGSIFAPPIEEMSPLVPFETIQRIMGSDLSSKSTRIVR
jgi:acetolactate synthase-1/2/3 large subunit